MRYNVCMVKLYRYKIKVGSKVYQCAMEAAVHDDFDFSSWAHKEAFAHLRNLIKRDGLEAEKQNVYPPKLISTR